MCFRGVLRVRSLGPASAESQACECGVSGPRVRTLWPTYYGAMFHTARIGVCLYASSDYKTDLSGCVFHFLHLVAL